MIRRLSTREVEELLDHFTSVLVRTATPYCVLCGVNNWRELDCGHYFGRMFRPTRWDFDNLATLCKDCNHKHNSNREPYTYWIINKLGERGYDDLCTRAHSSKKFSYSELLDLLEERKLMVKAA